jgi:hypothetical protein
MNDFLATAGQLWVDAPRYLTTDCSASPPRPPQSMSSTSRKPGAPFRPVDTLSSPQKPLFAPRAAAKAHARAETDYDSSFTEDLSAAHLGHSSSLFEHDDTNASPPCVSQPAPPHQERSSATDLTDRTRRSRHRTAAQAPTAAHAPPPWCENANLRHCSRRTRRHPPPPRCLCGNSRLPRRNLERPAR